MTTPEHPTANPARPRIHPERQRRVANALKIFSVLAWITGVFLLGLVTQMIMKYLLGLDTSPWGTWIAIAHGWIYMAFLLSTINLGLRARWDFGKSIVTALGGVVPFLSFIVEAKRRKEVKAKFQLD